MVMGDDTLIEQDYIMRLIKEMVRMLLKILFHIDADTPTAELLNETQEKQTLDTLLDLVDHGSINEAENRIFELTSYRNTISLETALLFYSYLNDKTDAFLEEHDFSREEIQTGLKTIISQYGLDSLADTFLT